MGGTLNIFLAVDESHIADLMQDGISAESLKAAFDTASSELSRKAQRNPLVNFLDLSHHMAHADVPGCPGVRLTLRKD